MSVQAFAHWLNNAEYGPPTPAVARANAAAKRFAAAVQANAVLLAEKPRHPCVICGMPTAGLGDAGDEAVPFCGRHVCWLVFQGVRT